MPPAANESQGLKIAVAAFVALTVILAVTTYFMYSNYSRTYEQFTAAEKKASEAQRSLSDALAQYQALRDQIGYSTLEDFEAVKAEMKKDSEKLSGEINEIARSVVEAVAKAQQGGETDPKFEELRGEAQKLVISYNNEPNKTYKDSLIRLKDLLRNLTSLTTALSLNDVALRQSLVASNTVNAERLAQETSAFQKSKDDLEAEHVQHEKERASLNSAVDEAQTRLRQLSTDLAQLQSKYDRYVEKSTRDYRLLQTINRELQERADKSDVVLDRADGKVLGVDYSRDEVRLDLTRAMGARPQMKMTIFDSSSPGLPTERPKARVELIEVTDRGSVARIEPGSTESLRPIRSGDLVYSAVWSPGDPQKIALIGKIDINRDGTDDRGDLIRMIEAAGGQVEYDLPPPDADPAPGQKAVARAYINRGETPPPRQGRASGELNSRFAWYVVDDRGAYYKDQKVDDVPTAEESAFVEEVSAAKGEARDNGIRPLPIDRLLAYMGYSSYNRIPTTGRSEYTNKAAIKALTQPKGNVATPTQEAAPSENGFDQ